MNILTINNKNLIGYNVYYFLEYYKEKCGYEINADKDGYLFIYEQYFPSQLFKEILKDKNEINLLKEKVDNFFSLSVNHLDKTKKIYFFYPFTFYSKYDYNFNILKTLKDMIETKFKKDCYFVLNNYFMDDYYNHFSAFRYDVFNNAKKIKKEKLETKKEKIFISLNAKIRTHREDLEKFIYKNKLSNNFYFSYTQKNINLWKTESFENFAKKYLKNEDGSGHFTFEYYLKDDFFNTKNGIFFDKSYYYIITETSCEDNLCFISEKTYKSFYHKIPFLIIGNPFTIKNLQNEGFKTFNKWIDESYDEEINYEKRKKKIFEEIKRLNSLTRQEHEKINQEMQITLDFNYEHFFDLSNFKNDFLKIF